MYLVKLPHHFVKVTKTTLPNIINHSIEDSDVSELFCYDELAFLNLMEKTSILKKLIGKRGSGSLGHGNNLDGQLLGLFIF